MCDVNFFDDNVKDGITKTCTNDKVDKTYKSNSSHHHRTYNGDKGVNNDNNKNNNSNDSNRNVTKGSDNASDYTKNSDNKTNRKDLKTGILSEKENKHDCSNNNNNNKKKIKEKIILSKLSKVPVLGRGLRNEKIDFEDEHNEDFLSYDKYTGAEEVGMSRLSFGNDKSLASTLSSVGKQSLKRNDAVQNPSRAKV